MMKLEFSPRDGTKLFKDMIKVNLYFVLQIFDALNKISQAVIPACRESDRQIPLEA
jgi:hypothetical protein